MPLRNQFIRQKSTSPQLVPLVCCEASSAMHATAVPHPHTPASSVGAASCECGVLPPERKEQKKIVRNDSNNKLHFYENITAAFKNGFILCTIHISIVQAFCNTCTPYYILHIFVLSIVS